MESFKKTVETLGLAVLIGLGIIIGYISGVHDGSERAELECGVSYEYQSKTSSNKSD